jgi:MarR family 2-MHQ and catechol resistance regulon transcriptional repressor
MSKKEISLEQSTWIKLHRAFTSLNNSTTSNIKSFGLTYPQFSIIETLGHLGPMKISDLYNKMLYNGGNMTIVLDQLEAKNILRRVNSKEDRRAILIELTEKGNELYQDICPENARHIKKLMSVLSEDELRNLGDLLKKLGTSN